MSVYLAARDTTTERLGEVCQATAREVTMTSDARVNHGLFAQQQLWCSTLPLGRDTARRKRKYVSRNVGDTFSLVGTSAVAPRHPLGVCAAGPHVGAHRPVRPGAHQPSDAVTGITGSGKTMATIILLIRALAQGATGFIIDRAGHFAFLVR